MSRRRALALLINNAGLGADYEGALRSGVEDACHERDLDLWVYAGRTDWTQSGARERHTYSLLTSARVDGIVFAAGLVASYIRPDNVLESLKQRCKVPMCAVGQRCRGIPSLLVDNRIGPGLIVDHLVGQHGCRRFAYIAGPAGHEESEQRLAGTQEALVEHGILLEDNAVRRGTLAAYSGYDAMCSLLESTIPFDAVITANDDMALGALDALHASRLNRLVSVAGFDDAASARFAARPLTTVRQPVPLLGRLAVACVIDQLEGRAVAESVELETELIVRESCGCRPTNMPLGRFDSDAAESVGDTAKLAALFAPLFTEVKQRERWAGNLIHAVEAESSGTPGALLETLGLLIDHLPHAHAPLDALQRVVTSLRTSSLGLHRSRSLEEAFHAATLFVGSQAYRRAGAQQIRMESLVQEFRQSWGQVATSLTLPALQRALIAELPRFSIQNGVVSVHAADDPGRLVPLVCLRNGVPVEPSELPYPAYQLVPDGAFDSSPRRSLTVLPLTFESERLGVAVLELPQGMEVYSLLREQIASAIKSVYLHQEMLEQERLRSQAEHQQRLATERLKSLSLIASGVAHDLNNALGPVVAFPEAIRREIEHSIPPASSSDVVADLNAIQQAGQRAARTIRDLLDLGCPNDAPTAYFDLNRMVEHEIENFEAMCQRQSGVTLIWQPVGQPLVVHASKSHLLRALSNLVLNAVEALAGYGVITIRTMPRVLAEAREGIERIEPGRYAVLEVHDTGTGILPENLSRVLEPFFSTKQRASPGCSGLGLAIVYRIVKDAAGFVSIESEPGHGTTLSIWLPAETEHECPKSPPAPEPVGGQERVLVLDDEVVQLRTARRILERLGYTVTTTQSAEEALKLCQDCNETAPFDLVIVDMVLPGQLDGVATVEQIRKLRPSQRALVATGYAPEQMHVSASQGTLPWLQKPYTLVELASAVRSALAEGTPGEL